MFLAQAQQITVEQTTGGNVFSGTMILFSLAIWIISIVAMWKVFEKAGEAGWKSIIPFYSAYTLCRIAGRNGWWFLGLMIPIVNLIVLVIIALDLARHFGKSEVFGIVGLFIFSLIGYLILGYGDAKYIGVKHA